MFPRKCYHPLQTLPLLITLIFLNHINSQYLITAIHTAPRQLSFTKHPIFLMEAQMNKMN